MHRKVRCIDLAPLILLLPWHGYGATAEHAHRVHINIIRRESSVHTSLETRDAYIVQVTPGSGKPFTARIVDQYPGYLDLNHPDGYRSARFSVALRRAPYCDSSPIAADDAAQLRCFEVVHSSWRLADHATADQWWK